MANEDKLEIESKTNYWRNTGRPVLVFGVSCFVVVPYLFWLFHWTLYTGAFAVVTTICLYILQRYQYTPVVALRYIKSRLSGRVVKRIRRIGSHRIWK